MMGMKDEISQRLERCARGASAAVENMEECMGGARPRMAEAAQWAAIATAYNTSVMSIQQAINHLAGRRPNTGWDPR